MRQVLERGGPVNAIEADLARLVNLEDRAQEIPALVDVKWIQGRRWVPRTHERRARQVSMPAVSAELPVLRKNQPRIEEAGISVRTA